MSKRFMLPAEQRRTELRDISLTDLSGARQNRAYFAEVGDRLFMALGRLVYEWDATNLRFNTFVRIGYAITSMVYFDGYLHLSIEGSYAWIRPDTREVGRISSFPYVSLFHVFGGFLYMATGDSVRYTNGSDWRYGNTGYPSDPSHWTWTDPIQVGSYGEEIIGMAGLIYQQIGQRYIWVSTASHLTAILPGDIPYSITEWPAKDERNGVSMIEFYDMVVMTVGGRTMSLRGNGDLNALEIGNEYRLPCEIDGSVNTLFSAANYPIAVVDGVTPTVWANHNSGWHFLARCEGKIVGGYHSSRQKRMILVNDDGEVFSHYMGDTSRDPVTDPNYVYARSGVLDLGWYAGALFETDKFWREVFADVICDHGYIQVLYTTSETEGCTTCNNIDYDAWELAGALTEQNPVVKLPSNLVSKRIRVALRLIRGDTDISPSLRAVGIRYTPRLKQRKRWSFTAQLPRECMFDVTGAQLQGYSQKEWDDRLLAIVAGTHPVKFVDIDLREYEVLVEGNRIISDLGCNGDDFGFVVEYALSLTEAD